MVLTMTTQIVLLNAEEARALLAPIIREEVSKSLEDFAILPLSRVWLTRQEMKKLTGWSDRTLQNLRDSGQIPFSQHGRKILYPRAGIMEFLEANTVNASRHGQVVNGWEATQ
jgi:excisionase family DNA binding protein